ncbi:uncharacterized protein AAES06_005348 isoform 2-T4 [Glossophaga mutica]
MPGVSEILTDQCQLEGGIAVYAEAKTSEAGWGCEPSANVSRTCSRVRETRGSRPRVVSGQAFCRKRAEWPCTHTSDLPQAAWGPGWPFRSSRRAEESWRTLGVIGHGG